MFTAKELASLDRKYFTVIIADEYDVTLISNNTRHVWFLRSVELPEQPICLIYHKHHVSHPYHMHGKTRTLRQAIKGIKQHDKFQLNGRRPA